MEFGTWVTCVPQKPFQYGNSHHVGLYINTATSKVKGKGIFFFMLVAKQAN